MSWRQVRSHHVPPEQIEKQLQDIESRLAQLEQDGVELEKRLRHCEEGPAFFIYSLSATLCLFVFSPH